MTYNKINLLEYLNKSNIMFSEHKHEPWFTVEQSKKSRGLIKGAHTKNLFLKDKKKKFFLLSCLEDKKIDLKKLKIAFDTNNLSFASNLQLKDTLGIEPGSVSPFGLINDTNKITRFYLDKDILEKNSVNFHPLINNSTINLSIRSFIDFIKKINVQLHLVDLEVYRLIDNGN